MPETKYTSYAELAEKTLRHITENTDNWTAFLSSCANLYKYPFADQLMIYAQRPDATACADFDTWNKRMGRYVKRGSTGIALIDDNGDRPRLRYVFDISDTGTRENTPEFHLWQCDKEQLDAALRDAYGVEARETFSKIEAVSETLAAEYWTEHRRDIADIIAESFLEEYDIDTVSVRFRQDAAVSMTYAVLNRCGMNPDMYMDSEDFQPIVEFNTSETATALGTAVSEMSETVLRTIEKTVKNAERTEEHENRADLHKRGRIQSPEFEAERDGENREVRQNEEGIPENTPSDTLQQAPALGETVRTSLGDRQDSTGENRADNERADSTEQREREDESGKSDALGADDEQHESPSGRSDPDRADLQLSTSGEQISLFDGMAFPTESEQIEYIDKAETAAFSAFSLSQDDIDTVLRYGGNADDGRMRITAEFMKDKSTEAHAAFLKSLYLGGNGYRVNGRDIAAWYADDGIRIASGRQAENVRYAQVILWTDAAKRIDELLGAGLFATETELAEAKGNERRLAAQELVYLQRDIREDVRDKYFDKSWFEGIFSESCDRITNMLSDNSMRNIVTDAASRFAEDYAKDKSLLLFHYHKPEETARKLRELSDMKRTFREGLTEMPPAEEFITEDEINHVFSGRGSGVSGGRARIYEYFTTEHTAKEKQDFLKNEYGTGGHSHALSGSSGSSEWHDGKGIRLQKNGCHDVQISWQNAVNRIQNLIRSERYFKPEVKTEAKDIEETPKNEPEPEVMPDREPVPAQDYHITDDTLGEAGPKAKFRMNMDAIYTLKILENENRNATPEEQETLAKYVGWGGIPEAFDEDNSSWIREYKELKAALTDEEYAAARASTLNAHYTSPTVIKAIYEAVGNMGFETGNILEPSMGVGNFFGLLPEFMQNSRLYGVELDSITGRIAQKLYPKADITVAGFETTDRRDFFDLAVGNVPFGNYKVNDKAYNKLNFSIHDYFFAKTLDQVRPGGVIAFITSRYTMDKQSNEVRKYIAERADLLGAIRLPNNAFKKNAGTEVVSDIIFLQKRDRPQVIEPDWIHLGQTEERIQHKQLLYRPSRNGSRKICDGGYAVRQAGLYC